jgi:hypothetical protein
LEIATQLRPLLRSESEPESASETEIQSKTESIHSTGKGQQEESTGDKNITTKGRERGTFPNDDDEHPLREPRPPVGNTMVKGRGKDKASAETDHDVMNPFFAVVIVGTFHWSGMGRLQIEW